MTEHDKIAFQSEAPVSPVPQQTGPSEGRRRLVKGALLAAPAVMTLRSGAALAASSSRCQAKIIKENEDKAKFISTEDHDQWLRATVDFRVYEKGNDQREFYLHNGAWLRAVDGTKATTDNSNPDELDGLLADGYTLLPEEQRLALVYVDNSGYAVGLANSETGDPTTPSCLCSFF